MLEIEHDLFDSHSGYWSICVLSVDHSRMSFKLGFNLEFRLKRKRKNLQLREWPVVRLCSSYYSLSLSSACLMLLELTHHAKLLPHWFTLHPQQELLLSNANISDSFSSHLGRHITPLSHSIHCYHINAIFPAICERIHFARLLVMWR